MTTDSRSTDTPAQTLFGNRFLTEPAPSKHFPEHGMTPTDAMRLVGEDLAMEGDPQRNLATFVTTWMEPEAQRIIAENLYRKATGDGRESVTAAIFWMKARAGWREIQRQEITGPSGDDLTLTIERVIVYPDGSREPLPGPRVIADG